MIREVLIAAAITAAVAAPLHPAAAAGPTLTLVPATVRQGDAAEIIVTGVIDSTVLLRFAGRTWPLYRSGAAWRTFVGTDPLTTPGLRTVTLEIRGPSGIIRLVGASIRVRRVSFPTRRITLDPDRRPLLDPRLAQEEGRTVAAALHRPIPDRLWEGSFRLPVRGVVSSPYGVVSVYQGQPRGFHHGIDLAAPAGTPVYAANNGIVRLAEKLPLSGNAVLIDHGMGVVTSYLHQSVLVVRAGDRVRRGQLIGRVGNTGLSTGSHLHWGMRVNGVHVDPRPWTGMRYP